jgi:hypothetical protein
LPQHCEIQIDAPPKYRSGLRPSGISSTLFELLAESPPSPAAVAPVAVQILAMEGWRMTRKSTLASLVVAIGLSLSLSACKDTKTLQENEQLKAQVADLQKQNGELGNNLETATASRDALIKENESLQVQLRASKTKTTAKKKVTSRKRRHS